MSSIIFGYLGEEQVAKLRRGEKAAQSAASPDEKDRAESVSLKILPRVEGNLGQKRN